MPYFIMLTCPCNVDPPILYSKTGVYRVGTGAFVCCLVHRGSTDDLLLLKISSGVVWQTRDLDLSHNTLYLLSPLLCFFVVLKRDLFVYRDDSGRRRGLVVERRTPEREVGGSILTRVAVLYP